MNNKEDIGTQLRALRLQQNLTTRELAELTGLNQSHIVRIEGGRYDIRLSTLDTITEALGAGISIEKKYKP